MFAALELAKPESLQQTPASDVKRQGWRGVMRSVHKGPVVITNHDRPEAVILTVGEYERIVEALAQAKGSDERALDALRKRFDERLAALRAPEAGQALRAAARAPVNLHGKVKVDSF